MEQGDSKAGAGLTARRDDGTVRISLSEDALEARGDFYPPIGEGRALDPDAVATILAQNNVVSGVDWQAVSDALMDCNLNRRIVRDVAVARGQAPREEVLEYYEADPAFRDWPALPEGDLPRIDFREISPFIIVSADQTLATFRPKSVGVQGCDVHGTALPFSVRKPDGARAGRNTRQTPEALLAACDGRLVEKGGELSVEEVLTVKGEVGYRTGHIVFPGDVVINGPVADGFKVYAGGSVAAKQTLDATEVIAKKDLVVAGGVIGRGRATVRVGGTLRARFIQHCRVACRGPIVVSTAVINPQVYTLQSLDLGEKGKLVGGDVFAVHGVRALSVGNPTGPAAKIHCGVDFTVQQELDRANERLRQIGLRLARLRRLLSQPAAAGDVVPPSDAAADEALRAAWREAAAKLEQDQAATGAKAGELLAKLDVDDQASVVVVGEIAAGTLVEICHIAYFLDQPLKRVRFRLDKTAGKLVHEPL